MTILSSSAADPTLWVHRDGDALLDAVTVRHGPSEHLARFFLIAAALAEKAGVTIRVHDDMHSLISANSQYPGGPWGPIAPAFNPSDSSLGHDRAFWISAHDDTGRLVACACAKLMEPQASMYEEFTSLRVFYERPGKYLAAGATCLPLEEAEAATKSVTGRVIYSGAQWTHPDYRARGIVYIMTRVTRLLGLTRWNVDYVTGVSRADLKVLGRLQDYGYVDSVRVVRFDRSYRGDLAMRFVWMARGRIESELSAYVASNERYITRAKDELDTPVPNTVDQGSKRRS